MQEYVQYSEVAEYVPRHINPKPPLMIYISNVPAQAWNAQSIGLYLRRLVDDIITSVNAKFNKDWLKDVDTGDSLRRTTLYLADAILRQQVDLRKWDSPVEDQYALGSCTGNAVANAYELLVLKTNPAQFIDLSRLFVYYNSRLEENNVAQDDGAYMRSAIKALARYGICCRNYLAYDISKFTVRPSSQAYNDAANRLIQNYRKVTSVDDTLDALNSDYPVVFGIDVYDGFALLDATQSTVLMPPKSASPTGAHAMCFVGYDLGKKCLLAKNSFGTAWGDKGYCWIPLEYAAEYMFDMWVFELLAK